MAKYKVLKSFMDIHTKKTYQVGQEVELEKNRFEEVEKNLEAFGGNYLEAVEIKPKKKVSKSKG
ncbi:hypothetical protein [Enterococcus sp. BWR-S5]|uniref:hypothetical protein n=1 Tax=Enterococcus sp. BWR-S5 TaxID=2787714 RepID=UPI001920775C|nr:hypothetical protein [Enterococcus sp. BWR-S5]MBL1225372.1 hypothetical protein [Enterococcus sp. BWR-S5]